MPGFPFSCFVGVGEKRQVVPLQGACPLQDMFLLIFCVDGGQHTYGLLFCRCFCCSCSEVSPAVPLPIPSLYQRPPSHQCSQQMICPVARTWRILLGYMYLESSCYFTFLLVLSPSPVVIQLMSSWNICCHFFSGDMAKQVLEPKFLLYWRKI